MMANSLQKSEQNELSSMSDIFFMDGMMEKVEHFAIQMAKGRSTIPDHLKQSPADCMAVILQSLQWGMNPYAVAQKTHLVAGTLGYEAQLVNAVITAMAPTQDRIHYDWFGNWENVIGKFKEMTSKANKKYTAPAWTLKDEAGLGVRVWATLKGEDEPRQLELLLSQAQVRNSTLWASDPKQQLAYLAVKRWARLYTPDVIMGVYTPDELKEQSSEPKNMGPAVVVDESKTKTQKLKDFLGGENAHDANIIEESVDTDTGEIVFTTDQVVKMIENAKTSDSLDEACDLIRTLPKNDQEGAVLAAQARRMELEG